MTNISLAPELYRQVEAMAEARNLSADDILAEAVRGYLWRSQRAKISVETRIYRERHAELRPQYLGQYIAMDNGQVVDHDIDFNDLHKRIRDRFGRSPVMITKVEEEPERVLMRHGFRIEKPYP